MKTQTIEAKLLFAQNAIQNAQNIEAVSSLLADYGYDQAALQAGMDLYTTADDLHQRQKQEYGEQFAATDALNLARVTANKAYIRHVKLARVALKGDRGAEESLQLSGNRKQSLSGWLQQAKTFYTNALGSAAIQAKLSTLTMTPEALTAAQALVLNVESKLSAQLKEKGEAQSATEARDKAFDELQYWMSSFVEVARIALEDEPQLLEVLGIVEPS